MPSVGDLFVEVKADLSGLSGVGQKIGRAFSGVRSSLAGIGAGLTAGITAPLVLLGKKAFDSAVELDQLTRGITAVAGSSAKAKIQLQNLREVAKLPGLSFTDAVRGSINLQAAGLSAEFAERSLSAFGNALATVGKGAADLAGLNLALTQIGTSTKLTQQDLNQLRERVPQVTQVLRDAFGTTTAEGIRALGLTSKQVLEGIVSGLEELPSVSGGIANDLENASQAIQESFQTLGAIIIPLVSEILTKVVAVIQNIAAAFSSLPGPVQRSIVVFAGLAAVLGPVLLALSAAISPIGFTVIAVAALAGAATLVYQNFAGLSVFFGKMWNDIKSITQTSIALIIQFTANLWTNVLDLFLNGISNVLSAFTVLAVQLGAVDFASTIADIALAVRELIPESTIDANKEKLDELEGAYNVAFANIVGTVFSAGGNIKGAFNKLIADAKAALAALTAPAGGGGGKIAPSTVPELSKAEGFEFSLPGTDELPVANEAAAEFAETLDTSFSGLLDLAEPVGVAINNLTFGLGEAAVQAFSFRGNFEGIKAAAKSLGATFKAFFQDLIAGFVRAIAKALILKGILAITGLGSASAAGGILTSVFGGSRAGGGSVFPGASFLVGEKGPELFTPRQAGTITPNGASLGGTIPVSIKATTFDVGGDQLRFVIEQADKTSLRRRGF